VKIAVVGAGAIGGYVGGWLAAAGEDVTFIARGANLAAIRQNGMRVIGEDGAEIVARTAVFDKTVDAGQQDFVILAVKAHQVGPIAADIAALCHAETAIVTMQNGIPWWYFHKHGGELEGTAVRSADPDGSIARLIDANRVIGSVVYPAAVLEAPGVVHVVEGKRFTLGEPDGSTSPRAQAISACRGASRSARLWKIYARPDDGARAELPGVADHRRAAGFLREMRELCPHRTGE